MTSSEHVAASALPELLRPLFWDHEFSEISWSAHREFVIDRVMRAGCPCGMVPLPDAIDWLRARVSDDELRAHLERRRGRGFSGRQLRWWAEVLRIPEETLAEWLGAPERKAWDYLR